MLRRSSALIRPASSSAAEWAIEPSISYGQSRQSKEIDSEYDWSSAAVGSLKRPFHMGERFRTSRPNHKQVFVDNSRRSSRSASAAPPGRMFVIQDPAAGAEPMPVGNRIGLPPARSSQAPAW